MELDAITLTAPEGWGRKPTSSGFLLAEFTLPRADGDDWDGRLTVSSAGGDIEANIDRWRGQFGGKPSNETRRKIEADGLEIAIVDLSGDYSDQRGPMCQPSIVQARGCWRQSFLCPANCILLKPSERKRRLPPKRKASTGSSARLRNDRRSTAQLARCNHPPRGRTIESPFVPGAGVRS